ncbi:MAG: hypothetical protein GX957_01730 [Clostridiaceae bacterium]|nr:hypothetical protein [Clostridiaceae bacterium]
MPILKGTEAEHTAVSGAMDGGATRLVSWMETRSGSGMPADRCQYPKALSYSPKIRRIVNAILL